MPDANPAMRRCRCDGRYDGCEHGKSCPATAGATHSHLFCQPCDERRRAHITSRLVEFRDALA